MIAGRAAPPVLLELSGSQALELRSTEPGAVSGQPFSDESYADVVIDAELGLLDAELEDRVGLFFRQTAEQRYAACTLSAAGRVAIGLVDGGAPIIIGEADLTDQAFFHAGVGADNRLSVVSCGPVAAVMVNGVSVLGAVLDRRYVSGRAGALLVHRSSKPSPRLVVRWLQVRALLGPI